MSILIIMISMVFILTLFNTIIMYIFLETLLKNYKTVRDEALKNFNKDIKAVIVFTLDNKGNVIQSIAGREDDIMKGMTHLELQIAKLRIEARLGKEKNVVR